MQRQAAWRLSQWSQHSVSSHLLCRRKGNWGQAKPSALCKASVLAKHSSMQCLTWANGQGCSDVPQLDKWALEVIPHDPAACAQADAAPPHHHRDAALMPCDMHLKAGRLGRDCRRGQ